MTETARAFNWQGGLTDAERSAVVYSDPGELLADDDWYLDATSPKRGPVESMDGERVPAGGVYIRKSKTTDELWTRLHAAASGKLS